MKYERTRHFKRDYRRLSAEEQEHFKRCVLEDFAPALEIYVAEAGERLPARLRVEDVKGALGVLEMTWSFSDPDGRATWEWVTIAGETEIRWRRVGSHSSFARP